MIIFLYGQDTYSSRQKLKEIVAEYKKRHKSGLNFIRINFEENDFDDLKQVIETVSMFDEKKLIITERIFKQPENFQEKLLEYFKDKKIATDKNIILVIFTEDAVEKNDLFKFLKDKTKAQEFKLLPSHKLKQWIKDYVKEQGGKLENQAIDKLVDYIGNDLWRMSNELNKLVSHKIQITAQDVERLVKPKIDVNIFDTIDALGQKNKKQALKLIRNHLKQGEKENYLLDRFVYQFRNLLKVKTGGGKDLHPFVYKKAQAQTRNFDFEELKKIYQKLLEIDLNIKTGKVEARTALELFVVNL